MAGRTDGGGGGGGGGEGEAAAVAREATAGGAGTGGGAAEAGVAVQLGMSKGGTEIAAKAISTHLELNPECGGVQERLLQRLQRVKTRGQFSENIFISLMLVSK